MRCPQCGHDNPEGVKFCGECGTRIEGLCPSCGTSNPPTNKLCHECGQALAPPPAPAIRFASPQSYTPPHLAEKILTSRTALQGERKQVTVLFADVYGFTSISEKLDPEEVHHLMNQAFELMLGEVHRYEGTINQFLGDGVMALFGAPIAHEDHAQRAVRAALGMQRVLQGYGAELQRTQGITFRVRLGLNTGLVEEVLLYLVDSLPAARVLLLVTYRPGYQNPFGERTYTTRIGLRTLSDHDSLRLAAGMLAMAEFPPELRDLIIRKAEGNPFFLEEVLKSLLEVGALRQHDGRYVLTKHISEIYVPDTVQDVIMARIDRLEEAPKRALQLASIIGREFTVRLLERISDVQAQLDRFLQELKVLEFIYERSFYPELAYMFKHALTHDVAYNSLLRQRRKELHRLVAMAIEELYAERLPESYEMLAYHYGRGEVWEKALEYLVKAGQKAQQAYANQEARDHYSRALDMCERLGEAVEPATRMTIYAGKGAVHFLLSEFRASVEAHQGLLELARQLGDRHKEVEAVYQIGQGFFWAHEFEKALDLSHQAQALASEIGNRNILAASLFAIACVHGVTGKLDEASHGLEEALQVSREAGDKGLEWFILVILGHLHSWKGEYEQALQLLEEGFTIGHAHDLQLILLWSLWMRGLFHGGKGEYTEALAALQEALALSDRLGDKVFRCRILNTWGWVYGELYNLETAIQYNREGTEASYKVGDPEIIRNAEINLGDDYLLLGDLEQAQRYLQKVYRDTQQRGQWGEEWMKWRYAQHLYHSLGELWLAKGDAAQALECAEECLKLAAPTLSRKNLVKGWRLKGQALLAQGQGEQAEAALSRALTIAREIGNPPQLWKTYQALGALYESQADLEHARAAYQSALEIIDGVAARLQNQELRGTFLQARPVQELRARLTKMEPA